VYARCDLNVTTPHGGKSTVGAPGLLQHITLGCMLEGLEAHKGYHGYHQVSLSRVASALCGTRTLARDGTEQDVVWCVLPMGDAASSNSHNAYSVVPRLNVNWVLDPTTRCSVQLNATEFAFTTPRSRPLPVRARGHGGKTFTGWTRMTTTAQVTAHITWTVPIIPSCRCGRCAFLLRRWSERHLQFTSG
jgi:hypothetical protein